jgi:putative oxidoreductase
MWSRLRRQTPEAPPGAGGRDLALLWIRLWFGLVLALSHGLPKALDLDDFIGTVTRHGFPLPRVSALIAVTAELGGGLLLALGLFARPAAALVIATMLGAALKVHWTDRFMKKELALAYGAAALAVLIAGPGRHAVDTWLKQRRQRRLTSAR